MKDIDKKEIGLHKAYYALDLCLLHRHRMWMTNTDSFNLLLYP